MGGYGTPRQSPAQLELRANRKLFRVRSWPPASSLVVVRVPIEFRHLPLQFEEISAETIRTVLVTNGAITNSFGASFQG